MNRENRFGFKSDRGTTLIEVLFVLVVLIIVATVSVPLFSRTTSFARLRGDTYDIAGKLTQAKFRSATDLTGYQVRFDLDNNKFVLERHDPGTFTAVEAVVQLRTGVRFATAGDMSSFSSVPT